MASQGLRMMRLGWGQKKKLAPFEVYSINENEHFGNGKELRMSVSH